MRNYQLGFAIAAFSAIACNGSKDVKVATRLTPNHFIDAMVAVELAQPANRASVLQQKRATEADLREFVQKYSAADPGRLSVYLDSIQVRIDRAHETAP